MRAAEHHVRAMRLFILVAMLITVTGVNATGWQYSGAAADGRTSVVLLMDDQKEYARVITLSGHLILDKRWHELGEAACYLVQDEEERAIICGARAPTRLRGVIYARDATRSTPQRPVMRCVHRCSKHIPASLTLAND